MYPFNVIMHVYLGTYSPLSGRTRYPHPLQPQRPFVNPALDAHRSERPWASACMCPQPSVLSSLSARPLAWGSHARTIDDSSHLSICPAQSLQLYPGWQPKLWQEYVIHPGPICGDFVPMDPVCGPTIWLRLSSLNETLDDWKSVPRGSCCDLGMDGARMLLCDLCILAHGIINRV